MRKPCRLRSFAFSAPCVRSTPRKSCADSSAAIVKKMAWRKTRRLKHSPRCGCTSTLGAGPMCLSTFAPARTCRIDLAVKGDGRQLAARAVGVERRGCGRHHPHHPGDAPALLEVAGHGMRQQARAFKTAETVQILVEAAHRHRHAAAQRARGLGHLAPAGRPGGVNLWHTRRPARRHADESAAVQALRVQRGRAHLGQGKRAGGTQG